MNEQKYRTSNSSVYKKQISYKTHIKGIKRTAIASVLSTVIAMSGYGAIKDTVKDIVNDWSTDAKLVTMVSADEENNYSSLVGKSSYIVDKTTGAYAYNTTSLARDLLNVPTEYFDIALYNTYKNMINKTKNMDSLFKDLNFESERIKYSNPELYHKIKGIESFDEYLIKSKLIDKNGKASKELFEEKEKQELELYRNAMQIDSSKGKRK